MMKKRFYAFLSFQQFITVHCIKAIALKLTTHCSRLKIQIPTYVKSTIQYLTVGIPSSTKPTYLHPKAVESNRNVR